MTPLVLFAWIGEDEYGSGVIGLKQARVPAGLIPLVVTERDKHKITRVEVVAQLQAQALASGKTIRLARFEMTRDELVLPGRPSEPHVVGTDPPTPENDPVGRFRGER